MFGNNDMKAKSVKTSYGFDLPFLVLNKKEAEEFTNAIDNPPKANKALKELIQEIKENRSTNIFSFLRRFS